MEHARIAAVGVAHPRFRLGQEEAADWIVAAGADARRVRPLARATRIAERALVLPPADLLGLGSIEERNRIYGDHAPALALEAAAAALGESPRDAVRAVMTSSCTGVSLPGWGSTLLDALGLPPDATRLPVTEAGCAGGVVALARATDFLRARPTANALVVSVELCSLAFHPADDHSKLAAALVFGDGAGAALLHAGAGPGLEIVDSMSVLVPGTRRAIGFELTDHGFSPVLARDLPGLVSAPTAEAVHTLLQRNALAEEDVGAWLLHPGGARILEALENALELSPGEARWSWDSMREHGNTSSAAIFDVLRRYLEDRPRGYSVVVGLGPGVSIELLLLHASC